MDEFPFHYHSDQAKDYLFGKLCFTISPCIETGKGGAARPPEGRILKGRLNGYGKTVEEAWHDDGAFEGTVNHAHKTSCKDVVLYGSNDPAAFSNDTHASWTQFASFQMAQAIASRIFCKFRVGEHPTSNKEHPTGQGRRARVADTKLKGINSLSSRTWKLDIPCWMLKIAELF